MSLSRAPRWAPLFFAISACSWVPHWACHYYRLETGSGFAVGSWRFSPTDSTIAAVVYAALICMNLWAVADDRIRKAVASLSGTLHLAFAALHFYRLIQPFRFEVFGYPWPLSASLREAVILFAFGVVSLLAAARVRT